MSDQDLREQAMEVILHSILDTAADHGAKPPKTWRPSAPPHVQYKDLHRFMTRRALGINRMPNGTRDEELKIYFRFAQTRDLPWYAEADPGRRSVLPW